ncbi:secondary thiamine-phosphate synthase enzyme YjbQ [Selenomonadales bacterium OttesenSCG-928-I06]|nr:secondary thiamine-phosphate synthase enzyme YjbQ [Selenomonadales bacterium OttesenSCG-928-I06]
MIYTFNLQTPNEGFIDITNKVKEALEKNLIAEGICIIYCPHTTAGITINENADPDVTKDLIFALKDIFPDKKEFVHMEGNSAAHLKASMIGSSATVIISEGNLLLGTWQGIYFCEFDGPRSRKFFVKIIKG